MTIAHLFQPVIGLFSSALIAGKRSWSETSLVASTLLIWTTGTEVNALPQRTKEISHRVKDSIRSRESPTQINLVDATVWKEASDSTKEEVTETVIQERAWTRIRISLQRATWTIELTEPTIQACQRQRRKMAYFREIQMRVLTGKSNSQDRVTELGWWRRLINSSRIITTRVNRDISILMRCILGTELHHKIRIGTDPQIKTKTTDFKKPTAAFQTWD